MEVYITMKREFIESINDHPFERQKAKEEKFDFYIEESFEKKGDCIEGELRCWKKDNQFCYGSVEIYFNIEKFQKELHAGFGYLEVPLRIANQGIGKTLMLHVIKVIKKFKEYYSISETVTLTGWLSRADKENGNWNKAVPLYEKIGKLAEVECYFTIKDDDQYYTAAEFLEKANIDGGITYLI